MVRRLDFLEGKYNKIHRVKIKNIVKNNYIFTLYKFIIKIKIKMKL